MIHITETGFPDAALALYRHQRDHNPIYGRFCSLVGAPADLQDWTRIPFLPITFFRDHDLRTGIFTPQAVFESSGTTGTIPSRHRVADTGLYNTVARAGFERIYGPLEDWCILALLPSYLERGQSSLVHMVQHFVERGGHPESGFFLYDHAVLAGRLRHLEAVGQKTLLIGVTYALLDFAAAFPQPLQHTVVMETGGMKGRRRELLRAEVHRELQAAFGLAAIHSEYGMTELLSQAYAPAAGLFSCPPWTRVLAVEEDDPGAAHTTAGNSGRLCVIDLANVHSCAFIATGDSVRLHEGGRFEVLGRLDHTDIRGCSLLAL
ncbi:acyl transferase [Flaviaesturariibacter flavus]|uniref:Acyl transferase n=1 Tax=Flaviaesturariibacter flavus TaxID=2502780 RepID=A0A4R1B858_9BACT|nr:acyl transferase [Flaviaesturariibacter flavus]